MCKCISWQVQKQPNPLQMSPAQKQGAEDNSYICWSQVVQSALDSCSCITPLLWQQRADMSLLGFVSSGSVKTFLDQLQPYTSQLRHSWNHNSFTKWPSNPFRGTAADWSHSQHIRWGISAWITDRQCPAHLLYLYFMGEIPFPHCSLCVPSVIFIEGTTHTAGVLLLPTKDPYLSANKAQRNGLAV